MSVDWCLKYFVVLYPFHLKEELYSFHWPIWIASVIAACLGIAIKTAVNISTTVLRH